MRNTFIQTLTELAEQDERIILMTADLGFTVLEDFAEKFPKRFFNVGVAEQNMAGIATGLAEAGYIPFIYSIGTFASMRGYEFIRNGAVMHGFPIRIVGIGAGLEYSKAGLSHMSLEEIAIMRAQPNLRVIAPADYEQTRNALLSTWNLPQPIYYRIGKNDKQTISGLDGRFTLDGADLIADGNDVLLMTTGSIASEVVKLASELSKQQIESTVAVISSLNPTPDISALLEKFQYVLTIEDHYITGGLGSMVAEVIADDGLNCSLKRCGISHNPDGITGSLSALRDHYGLSKEKLLQTALEVIRHNQPA